MARNMSNRWKITWDKQAEYWEKISSDPNNYWNRKTHYVFDIITKHVNIAEHNNKEFLDIGCATGTLLEIMHDKGFSIRGIDVSPKMISYARKRLNKVFDVKQRIRVVETPSIPFENTFFDVITILAVLPYIADYQDYINKVYGLAKPGGIVLAESMNRLSIRNLINCLVICTKTSQKIGTLKNLVRTGYWSGGAAYEANANQAYSALKLDTMFTNSGFELIDELNIFDLRISCFDNNCTHRSRMGKILARYLAWTHIGVYEKIK